MKHLPKLFMVFDVESVGLHGEGFAAGWVVISQEGIELSADIAATSHYHAAGTHDDHEWVKANVPQDLPRIGEGGRPFAVRDSFWKAWLVAKAKGAVLVADCAWPVEARFLIDCINDCPISRTSQGPYPLLELSSFLIAADMDPLATYDRLPNELPVHNPLADARQSARLLMKAISALQGV